MRIASFNLESLDLPPKADIALEERIRIIRPQIVRLDADILCLQEVNGQHEAGKKCRKLLALDQLLETTTYAQYERVHTTVHGGKGAADIHNLVILSRFPIKSHRQFKNDLVAPPDYAISTSTPPSGQIFQVGWDRPVLYGEIELPNGRSLHVLNVHLRAPLAAPIPGGKKAPFVWDSVGAWAEGYFIASMMRTGQALETRLAVDQILDGDENAIVIVLGDFNAEANETAFRIIKGAEEDTGNGRLAHRALISFERSLTSDRVFSVIHHGRAQMLDHMLVTRPLLAAFEQLEIHNETLEDELVGYAKTDRPPDSYHAPLLAEFLLD